MTTPDDIVSRAPVAIIVIDRNGSIAELNRKARLALGCAGDELVGTPVKSLFPRLAGPADGVPDELLASLDDPDGCADGWRTVEIVGCSGEPFAAEVSVTRLAGEPAGRVALYVQDHRDFASLAALAGRAQKAEGAAELTRERLRDAIESFEHGFILYDRDDRMVVANEAARRLYAPIAPTLVAGASHDEIIRAGLARHIWQLNDRDPDAFAGSMRADPAPGMGQETELVLYDGRHVICREHRNDRGERVSAIVDVTAERVHEQELAQTRDKLENIAYTDDLTGLGNRKRFHIDYFDDRSYTSKHSRFAIIHLDIDNFKRYNDTFGHAAGDLIIKEIGRRLNFITEEFEWSRAYRWGGDEFIILVDRPDGFDIDSFCQEITDIMAIPLTVEGAAFHPTASLGVALYPEDCDDPRLLLNYADLALYKSKEIGRDAYSFFSTEMRTAADRYSWVETNIGEGIERGELFLCYQPQIDPHTGAVLGVEALLRWNHSELGLIRPNYFLPALEKSRHVAAVNRLVFDQAMKAARLWIDTGLEFGRIAVNLSPQHIKLGSAVDDLIEAMERHRVAPDHVGIEVVESVFVDDPTVRGRHLFEDLDNLGVHITLDDFGTGYASLSHLSEFPVGGLKVDRSFILAEDQVDKKREVIRTLVNLSRMIKIEAVCEGVETIEQFSFVKDCGNCAVQGFLVARPMKLDKATTWLGRQEGVAIVDQLNESLYPADRRRIAGE